MQIQSNPGHEITNTRIFNAPQILVFEAFSNPSRLKNWWGPNGFTNTFHEFDFKPGGHWRFTMHGPEKGHYENHAEFTQIEKPSLISWKRHLQPFFNMDVVLEAIAEDKTRITFRMIFDSEKTYNTSARNRARKKRGKL